MKTTRREFLGRSAQFGAAGVAAMALGASAAETPPNGPWKIGIYTRPWDKFDYRVALDAIAEAGYKYAGLMTTNNENRLVISQKTTPDEAQEVAEECKKRDLEVPSVYGGGIPVNESLEAGIAGMRRLIDNCAIVKADNLLMGGIGNKELYDAYYKAIAETCDYAAEKGVGVSVKPHGGLNATGPQCRKTVEETVGHKNFRIWYDPGNIFYYSNGERNPVDDAEAVDGLVVGMCVKDYEHPKNVAITPGDGMVDFEKVMAVLKEGGFTKGALVVECVSPGDEAHLLSEAKRARKFVEELVAK
ncbi:MAG: sugar phosphate isomerase/epimerase family protein [Candidatus Hydrogenedentota bacterium]